MGVRKIRAERFGRGQSVRQDRAFVCLCGSFGLGRPVQSVVVTFASIGAVFPFRHVKGEMVSFEEHIHTHNMRESFPQLVRIIIRKQVGRAFEMGKTMILLDTSEDIHWCGICIRPGYESCVHHDVSGKMCFGEGHVEFVAGV